MSSPMFNAAQERFGTARFADEASIQKAGLFTYAPNAMFIGFFDAPSGKGRGHRPYRRALWYTPTPLESCFRYLR